MAMAATHTDYQDGLFPMQAYDHAFRESFTRIMGDGAYNPAFIGRFYELFLASSPAIAERFAGTDMRRQKTMLHDSFTTLMDFNEHRRLTPQMRRLAIVHGPGHSDVPPDLYTLWLESLMATAREFDPAWDPDVELAWRLTLAPGIAYLQHAYAHPPSDARAR
jgi:hemoglobin-like flavoprotein